MVQLPPPIACVKHVQKRFAEHAKLTSVAVTRLALLIAIVEFTLRPTVRIRVRLAVATTNVARRPGGGAAARCGAKLADVYVHGVLRSTAGFALRPLKRRL